MTGDPWKQTESLGRTSLLIGGRYGKFCRNSHGEFEPSQPLAETATVPAEVDRRNLPGN